MALTQQPPATPGGTERRDQTRHPDEPPSRLSSAWRNLFGGATDPEGAYPARLSRFSRECRPRWKAWTCLF